MSEVKFTDIFDGVIYSFESLDVSFGGPTYYILMFRDCLVEYVKYFECQCGPDALQKDLEYLDDLLSDIIGGNQVEMEVVTQRLKDIRENVTGQEYV